MVSTGDEVINILLIGETGVGKSTFINSFANYVNFSNFEDAKEAEDISVLIPTSFTIIDENFDEQVIQVGKDQNEYIQPGASATQHCRTYSFRSNDTKMVIRFIDTPGVGDTRGIEQDEKNLAHMVDYLGKFDYINAIVIMLLPNNARTTVLFDYCIKQLLAALERSAVNNIAFVFTNSRGSFYKPGDTLQPLKAILKDIRTRPPHIDVPFNKTNTFCFDNEAFRFLIASRQHHVFDESNIKGFADSWRISATAAEDLLGFIVNREPHNIKNSLSLVKARTAIEKLRKPLAEISQLIQNNIERYERYQKQLSDNTKTVDELRKLLHVKRIHLRIKKLDEMMNVCTHHECTEPYQIEDSTSIHYKSECHYPCRVRGVKSLERSDERMRHCSGMHNKGKPEAYCKKCSHHHLHHMHIHYKTEPYDVQVMDQQVHDDLEKKSIDQTDIEAALKKADEEKAKYESEEAIVQQSVAKFAFYLKNSAIVSYNDAYEQYLRYLIEREKQRGDVAKIRNYEKLIEGYQEQKRLLDEQFNKASQENSSTEQSTLTGAEILQLIEDLFKLELTGILIKDMYEAVDDHTSIEIDEKLIETNSTGSKRYFKGAFKKLKGVIGL